MSHQPPLMALIQTNGTNRSGTQNGTAANSFVTAECCIVLDSAVSLMAVPLCSTTRYPIMRCNALQINSQL